MSDLFLLLMFKFEYYLITHALIELHLISKE